MMEAVPSPDDQEILDLPLDLFRRVCAELQALGTESLVLIGEGEPLLHRHAFEMIAMAKEVGLHVTMLTNGTLLDARRTQALIETGPDLLKVSLWASSREEYERNYPGSDPGNFDRIMDGLQRLSRAKAARDRKLPVVALHQPINRNNFQNIEAMVGLAQTSGCEMLSFSPFETRRREFSELALSPSEERQVRSTLSRMRGRMNAIGIRHNIDSTLLRYRIGEAVWHRVPCYIGWHHVRIRVDGTVLPCAPCDLPIGNLNEQSLREIWNSPALEDFRQQTVTRQGLEELGEHCDCGFCCHLENNWRIHRAFRWAAPLVARSAR